MEKNKRNETYSLLEKRRYYHHRSLLGKTEAIRKHARRRYEEIKSYTPKPYQPKYVIRAKDYETTFADEIKKLEKAKGLYDFLEDTPKYRKIKFQQHQKYANEIGRLQEFRRKNRLSLSDPFKIVKNYK